MAAWPPERTRRDRHPPGRTPCSSHDAPPPTRTPGRSRSPRSWPPGSSSSSPPTRPVPRQRAGRCRVGAAPHAELFTALPGILGGDGRAGLDPGPPPRPRCSTPAWSSPRSSPSCCIVWAVSAGCGRGARPGCAAWPPAPKPQPSSALAAAPGRAGGPPRPAPQAAAPMRRLRAHRRRLALGDAHEPRGGELWVPWDRTAGVIGPQGSGKTLDLLTPALLAAPGAALVTLTKVDDLLLPSTERSRDGPPRASCSTRSAWPRACPSWSGTRSPAAWTRWSPSGAPRPSPPAPSRARSPAATATTPPGSTPPKPRR